MQTKQNIQKQQKKTTDRLNWPPVDITRECNCMFVRWCAFDVQSDDVVRSNRYNLI